MNTNENENPPFTIRRATIEDLPSLVEFAVKLIRQHQAYDADRFTAFEPLADKYAEFFSDQSENRQAAILVAKLENRIVGYAFLKIEEESFLDVRTATVWLHDIYLDEAARGQQIGARLLDAAVEAARDLGSGSMMLSVSPHNERARKIFQQYGFRPTMLEMRLDFGNEENKI